MRRSSQMQGKSSDLDDRSQAFGAQHFGLLPFSMPDRDPLKVGFKGALRGPFRKRTVMTEGKCFPAMFAFCHCQIPSWNLISAANRPASYHRKNRRARQIQPPSGTPPR
jgi:hypothetical protein